MSVFLEGAAGSLAGGIDFKNDSATGCKLSGRPAVSFLDSEGRTIPATFSSRDAEWEAGVVAPGWPSVYLRPDDTGTAFVHMSEWCTPREPARWSVRVPSIDALFKPLSKETATCHAAHISRDAKPSLDVGPIQPHPLPVPTASYPFTISIHAPATVTAKKALRYRVTLTNTSSSPVRFRDCPTYVETIGGRGIKVEGRYVLNCASLGAVHPDEAVTFAMVLPSDAWIVWRSGAASLGWSLEVSNSPAGVVPIVVAGA